MSSMAMMVIGGVLMALSVVILVALHGVDSDDN